MNPIFIKRPCELDFLLKCLKIRDNYRAYGELVIQKEFENENVSKTWIIGKKARAELKEILRGSCSEKEFSEQIQKFWKKNISTEIDSIRLLILTLESKDQAAIIRSEKVRTNYFEDPYSIVLTEDLWKKIKANEICYNEGFGILGKKIYAIKDTEGSIHLFENLSGSLHWKAKIEPDKIIEE